MYIYPFEKLEVWQLARKLVVKIYLHTKNFPADEKFGLVNQMRRAAVSISSNLAEGSSRISKKEQAHFYTMAYGSLMELLSQCLISFDLGWLKEEEIKLIRNDLQLISLKINSLRKAILSSE